MEGYFWGIFYPYEFDSEPKDWRFAQVAGILVRAGHRRSLVNVIFRLIMSAEIAHSVRKMPRIIRSDRSMSSGDDGISAAAVEPIVVCYRSKRTRFMLSPRN